jgi:hypothetical protein
VATQVSVGVFDAAVARDLVEALAVRGLIGTAVERDGSWSVDLDEPHEQPERLLAEVAGAVGAWLTDRGKPSARIRAAGRTITLRAGERLDDALRAQLRGRPGARR